MIARRWEGVVGGGVGAEDAVGLVGGTGLGIGGFEFVFVGIDVVGDLLVS